jgi:hypothetical protein
MSPHTNQKTLSDVKKDGRATPRGHLFHILWTWQQEIIPSASLT